MKNYYLQLKAISSHNYLLGIKYFTLKIFLDSSKPQFPFKVSKNLLWKKSFQCWATSDWKLHPTTRSSNQWNSQADAMAIPTYRQLRARKALSIFKDVPLRTRMTLLLYNVYGNSALLVLSRTSLNTDSALLALNWYFLGRSHLPQEAENVYPRK